MAEILSRSEVELLLAALDGKPAAADAWPASPPTAGTGALAADSESTSSLARAAVEFCEPFRLALQATLQQVLSPTAILRRQMPARTSFHDYLQESGDRPVRFVLETDFSPGDLLLAADRAFLVRLLFSLVGVQTTPSPDDVDRPWTELELRLWRRLLRHTCESLPPSLQWTLSGVEVAEAQSEFASWNTQSPWWVERWELRSGDLRGVLHFAAPWEALSHHRNLPEQQSGPRQDGSPESRELVAEIARIEITAGELANLKPGDVIVTDRAPDAPVTVMIDGNPAMTARPGLTEGRKAVQLIAPLPAPSPDE